MHASYYAFKLHNIILPCSVLLTVITILTIIARYLLVAGEITSELKKVQNDNNIRNTFCQCHNIRNLKLLDDYNYKCEVGYPTCGGKIILLQNTYH